MKLCKFINEFEIAKIATKCSVVMIFEASQNSTDGDGVSKKFSSFLNDVFPIDCELLDDEKASRDFLRAAFLSYPSSISSKFIKFNDFSCTNGFVSGAIRFDETLFVKLNAARFGGNMTKKWAPRDIRPNAIGYLGFFRLSFSVNSLSKLLSIDQTCKLDNKMCVRFIIDWAYLIFDFRMLISFMSIESNSLADTFRLVT